MSDVKIKQATIENLEPLAKLFDQYRQFYTQPPSLEESMLFIRNRIENRDTTIFIAQDSAGNVLGFTQLFPSFSSISVKPKWILNDLYVNENSRNKGVAKLLMAAAEGLAAETEADSIFLEVQVENKSAQTLYESLGYLKETEHFSYILKI